jgi:hypothetical protein
MRKRTEGTNPKLSADESTEPVGIVISNGTRREDAPRFAAYVWGPVPESELSEELVAVA